MGDMGEGWADHRKQRQEKREQNRNSSSEILKDKGIEFERKNMGAHLIVKHNEKTVDFWPGTGLWHCRQGKKGRGVRKLLNYLGENQ